MNQPVSDQAVAEIVDLRIPCKAEWVAVARLAVAAVASRLRFTIDEIEDIKLAVAEACTNAIQSTQSADALNVHCRVDLTGLRVEVSEIGAMRRELRVQEDDEEHMGGLGVFLIRALMDEVEYSVAPDRGTKLVMVKRLQPS